MDSTLILSFITTSQNSEMLQITELVQNVLGPSIMKNFTTFDGNMDGFSNVVMMLSSHCSADIENLQSVFYTYEQSLKNKSIGLLCIGNNTEYTPSLFHNVDAFVPASIRSNLLCMESIPFNSPILKEEISEKIIQFKRCLPSHSDMPTPLLKQHIDSILKSHNTCTLCTCSGSLVRGTPIEYIYENDAMYFLSEGGEKFAHLFANPNVSITVYHEYTGFNSLEGIQMEGIAEMVSLFSEEYLTIAQKRGLSPENIKKMPIQLHMFKVLPNRIQVLNSGFKKEGYAAKQLFFLR